MYYHAIVETTEKNKKGDFESCYELDCVKLEDIIEYIVAPYTKQETIYINGRYIDYPKIRSLKIKSSDKTLAELVNIAQSTVARNVFFVYTAITIVRGDKYVTDITKETIKSIGNITAPIIAKGSSKKIEPNNKIFIVHGRDDLAKTETARFVEKLGFTAIILHEQPSAGKTIIEKIEEHTDVGFAIALYTPCDVGSLAGASSQKSRARQNVVFEHGYLIAKLGRHNVCALVKGDIEIPNDISGIVYIPMDVHGAWNIAVAKELRKAGYSVDMNSVI
jgi:predicted nucleotide-binding protein